MAAALQDPTAETHSGKTHSGETVSHAIRRALLDAILFGDLAAPTRLYPADLAQRFGVSITPVREALARLATEGFIEGIPRHGYHVQLPTPEFVAELWDVRLALELMAGELILRRFPEPAHRAAALKPLGSILDKLAHTAAMSHRTHVALNGQFHDRLVELAGNVLLATSYQGIRVRLISAWVQRGTRGWRTRLSSEQAEHQAILDALTQGDRARLDAAIRAHLGRSLTDALSDARMTRSKQGEDTNEKAHPRGSGRGTRAARAAPRRDRRDDHPHVDVLEPLWKEPA